MNDVNDKLSLLQSVLGTYHKANRDYYQFMCPFHIGKNGPKLGVSLGTGGWKCWVCPNKGASIVSLFRKVRADEAKINLAKKIFPYREYQPTHSTSGSVQLPSEFLPLWTEQKSSYFYPQAKTFLESRGVEQSDIIKYRIGYCESGRYSGMIIFPSYDEYGILNFFSGRTFKTDYRCKFLMPEKIDKNVIINENIINWNEPLIIVESPLDAIAIKRNVTPIGGKILSTKLKQRIIENGTDIYSCLDGDAEDAVMNHADYFIQHGIKVYRVKLPIDQDPNSLGHNEVWKYIKNAKQINESDNFEFQIKNKLMR